MNPTFTSLKLTLRSDIFEELRKLIDTKKGLEEIKIPQKYKDIKDAAIPGADC